ncbi:MAG: hypothetical protein QJR07_05005 [Acetobacteraceae bacterium]|nr:hypothetical protein [Acetobacteraceae bacterium]
MASCLFPPERPDSRCLQPERGQVNGGFITTTLFDRTTNLAQDSFVRMASVMNGAHPGAGITLRPVLVFGFRCMQAGSMEYHGSAPTGVPGGLPVEE